jgi:hypothetical protein
VVAGKAGTGQVAFGPQHRGNMTGSQNLHCGHELLARFSVTILQAQCPPGGGMDAGDRPGLPGLQVHLAGVPACSMAAA